MEDQVTGWLDTITGAGAAVVAWFTSKFGESRKTKVLLAFGAFFAFMLVFIFLRGLFA